jgi:hypothetical protein
MKSSVKGSQANRKHVAKLEKAKPSALPKVLKTGSFIFSPPVTVPLKFNVTIAENGADLCPLICCAAAGVANEHHMRRRTQEIRAQNDLILPCLS